MTENDLIDLAMKRPLTDDQFKPADLHLDRKEGLKVQWQDGHTSHYPLVYLRKRCPCATCRIEREKPKPVTSSRSLNILPSNISLATEFANARIVGNYAVQIEWSDGHKTGIYDFRYLRLICPAEEFSEKK